MIQVPAVANVKNDQRKLACRKMGLEKEEKKTGPSLMQWTDAVDAVMVTKGQSEGTKRRPSEE